MSRYPKASFQVTKVLKSLAKHIISKYYIKIAIWNRHVFTWHRFTMNTKKYFQLEYLKWWSYKNDSLALVSGRYTLKYTEHIWKINQMNSDTLNFIWIPVFSIGIFEVSTPRKWSVCLYIRSKQITVFRTLETL